MSPFLPLNGTHASDVARAECGCGPSPEHEENEAWQPHVAELKARAALWSQIVRALCKEREEYT